MIDVDRNMCKKLRVTIDDVKEQQSYGGEYDYIGSVLDGKVFPFYKQAPSSIDPSMGVPVYLYHNGVQLVGTVSLKAIYRYVFYIFDNFDL
jgi:hypothetical protein